MDKPTVNDCNVCTEDGWYSVKDDRIEPRETCPNCSGAGRVVGVPADSIVVADDTRRVAVYPRMGINEPRRRLEALNPREDNVTYKLAVAVHTGIHEEPAAVFSFGLAVATEEEAPDARPI